MAPAIFDCADELVDKLVTHINASYGRQQSVINMRDQCCACALDIFGRIGLRHAFDALKSMPISPGHAAPLTIQTDATLIILAWRDLTRTSQYLSSLVARAFIRACPMVADLPLPGLASVSSQTIQRLTKPLLRRAQAASDGDNDNNNILSILARETKGLSEYQLVQNVRTTKLLYTFRVRLICRCLRYCTSKKTLPFGVLKQYLDPQDTKQWLALYLLFFQNSRATRTPRYLPSPPKVHQLPNTDL